MIKRVDLQDELYLLKMVPLSVLLISEILIIVILIYGIIDSAIHLLVFHSTSIKKIMYVHFNKIHVCESCHLAKQCMLPFTQSDHVSKHMFELIHIDIWGPTKVTSIHCHKVFLIVVDDFSRYTWVYLMHSKAETRNALLKFITFVQNQFNTKIKIIRSNNGQ